jgi:DNA-binding XRE family transcriptional regulator
MAKNFRKLREKMSPEAQRKSLAKAQEMIREMPLDELRAARALTQEQLAKILDVKQSAISKLERRTDMYVSTLSGFVKAMGGTLEIRAVFPDGAVIIDQFSTIGRRDVSVERSGPGRQGVSVDQ